MPGSSGVPPEEHLSRIMEGYLTTQLLYVAVQLRVAEVLAEGPHTAEALAARVGADAGALARMLRALVVEGVFDEDEEGRFVLTDVGSFLREDVPGSQRGSIAVRAEVYYPAAAGLLQTALDGRTAFEHHHGQRFFDYLAAHPEDEAAFQSSMAGRSALEASAVVAAYDFRPLRRLVDVGGGQGILLGAILQAAPGLDGVLVDRPVAVEQASARLRDEGLDGRYECVPGDFFATVPAGADAYLLSRVLHDWDDEDAGRILATCRDAMAPESLLLVVEAILPERARDRPAAIRMDLHMLELLGARERTEAEFRALLERSGFRLRRVFPTESPAGLSVLEAVLAARS